MLIGVPREIKRHEYRAGLTPAAVRDLKEDGHDILIQAGLGDGAGFADAQYVAAGGRIVASAAEIFTAAEMVVKVKEPQPDECRALRPGQVLFTYLHLAADSEQTRLLLDSGCVAIAYETVTDAAGHLPLLAPMSEIAGRMAIQVGAASLQKHAGGAGLLLGGVPGVLPAKVVVLGGGVSGSNAARMAAGLGADVTVVDRSIERLTDLDTQFGPRIKTAFATSEMIEALVHDADLVIGAVLIPGAAAPKLVTRDMVSRMRPGSVLVDIAIDQGGCFETSHATTHDDPTYVVDGVVHYCVANMPGAVPGTSTRALGNATLPFARRLAKLGWREAVDKTPGLRAGLNICAGRLTNRPVAEALGLTYAEPDLAG